MFTPPPLAFGEGERGMENKKDFFRRIYLEISIGKNGGTAITRPPDHNGRWSPSDQKNAFLITLGALATTHVVTGRYPEVGKNLKQTIANSEGVMDPTQRNIAEDFLISLGITDELEHHKYYLKFTSASLAHINQKLKKKGYYDSTKGTGYFKGYVLLFKMLHLPFPACEYFKELDK